MIDYRGRIAAVFFTSGCNFECGFCHNATLIGKKRAGIPWGQLAEACAKFKAEWVDAAVISGGEPTIDSQLSELISFFKDQNWAVKLDSNGSRPDILQDCLSRIDCCAMDVKTKLDEYPALTGFTEVDRIRQSIELLKGWSGRVEFRTTIIEGIHTPESIHAIGRLLQGAPRYILQSFIPREDLPGKQFRGIKRTSPQLLEECRQIASQYIDEVVVI